MQLESVSVVPELLRTGVWWDFATKMPCVPKTEPHPSHFCLLVAPFGAEHSRALDELRMPHLDEIRANKGVIPDGISDHIRGTALARTVLKGWRNAEVGGAPFPYTMENAIELMVSIRWILIRRFVESAAANEYAIIEEEEDKAKGN